MNITLLHNYILVKSTDKDANTLASGLIVSQDDALAYGEVVAVGRGHLLENGEMAPIDQLQVGSKIMYKKGGDRVVNIENEAYVLINDVSVIMIFN